MLIQIVVAVVDHVLQNADDLVGNAVHANTFPDGILAGEQLFLDVRADKRHTSVGKILSLAEATPSANSMRRMRG